MNTAQKEKFEDNANYYVLVTDGKLLNGNYRSQELAENQASLILINYGYKPEVKTIDEVRVQRVLNMLPKVDLFKSNKGDILCAIGACINQLNNILKTFEQ